MFAAGECMRADTIGSLFREGQCQHDLTESSSGFYQEFNAGFASGKTKESELAQYINVSGNN